MKLLLTTLFVFYFNLIKCQNLVPNAGFESMHECPADYNKVAGAFWATDWYAANAGTPDYFHTCSKLSGVPLNWMGYAEAAEGNAYAGAIVCMRRVDPKQIAYREYIGIKLIEPLKPDVQYSASMKVRLGLSCFCTCNGLGMLFTEKQLQSQGTVNFPLNPQIAMMQPIGNKNEWVMVSGNFTALGGEQYLTIGNFLSDQQITYREFDENYIETQQISQYAYFYIDDVKVSEIIDTIQNKPVNNPVAEDFSGHLEKGKKMVLNHLLFATDSITILKSSYQQLDQLVTAMRQMPSAKIVIGGHTDNTGTDEYNLQLSVKRAEAVRNYLLAKGLSKFRVIAKGYGHLQPIADNATQEGRALNRRVEFEVIE